MPWEVTGPVKERTRFIETDLTGLYTMFNGDFVVVLRDGTKVAGTRRYRAAYDMLTP